MRKGTNVFSFLFLLTLTLNVGCITQVQAEETPTIQTEIVLHKRMYIDPKAEPEDILNTGTPMPDAPFMDKEIAYGLNDVVFEWYDVTDYVKQQQKDNKTQQDIQTYFRDTEPARLAETFKANLLDTVVTKTIEGESGMAVIHTSSKEETPAYLILEKAAPLVKGQKIIKMATPMLVILPVENPLEEGTNLATIHLYPKNAQYKVPVPDEKEPPKPKPTPRPKKPFLPQTGEVKSIMALLGVVLTAVISYVWYRKRKNHRSI